MLALCLMLSGTYYAQNYAGIIGWSLITYVGHGLIIVGLIYVNPHIHNNYVI